MKRLLLIIFALLIIAAAGGAILLSQIDPKIIRDRLAATTIEATGKPLFIEATPSISIFPPGVSFGKASWGMFNGKPAAAGISAAVAGGLVSLELRPLLSGRIHIKELRLVRPEIFIRPEPEKQDPGAGRDLPPQKEAQSLALELARLEIKDGSVDYSPGVDEKSIKINKIMLEVSNFKPGAVSPVSLAFDFALADPQIEGAVKSSFDLALPAGQAHLSNGVLAFTPRKMPEAYSLKPLEIKFDARAALDSGNGEAHLASAAVSVNKLDLQDFKATLASRDGTWSAAPLAFALRSGGRVEMDLSSQTAKARHNARLKAEGVAVGPLMHALQGKRPVEGTADFNADLTAEGKDAAAVKSSLAGKGILSVRDIALAGVSPLPAEAAALLPGLPALPTRFDRLSAPFSASKGVISISPVTLSSPTLNASGQGQANLPREHLSFAADVKLAALTVPVVAEGPFSNISYGVNRKKLLQDSVNPRNLLDVTRGAGGRAGEGTRDLGKSLKNLIR